LKNDGYTTYRWEESKSGPPRKYHQITESGKKVLAEMKQDWKDLVSAVGNIIEEKS
jgi:PadR family transcriptional regulator PadR